jgi:quercetin dioxygenase-like cupin family protein
MQLTRNSRDTTRQPSERFTGEVYADVVMTATDESRVKASHVHFSPGARTAWHSHPNGQTIYVTEGVGLCQRKDDPIEMIFPGDSVFFEPNEDHWHGAAPNRFMTHLAIVQVTEEGKSAAWGAKVTDEEYAAARAEASAGER